MRDEFDKALSIGRENEEMIGLGKAWCTHIRTDRGEFGVGMVEEMTGLPISGGRFTCDFARSPVPFAAMQLTKSAVDFFEANCIGCGDRAPGGRVPNLRTWAEPRIAERNRRTEAAAEAERVAATERQQRIDHRTFTVGSSSAAAQEIVGLLNMLDVDRSDNEAADRLRDLAKLAPEAFDEVRNLLHIEAGQLRLPVLLEVLVDLGVGLGSQSLHSLCLSAVRGDWARSVGCQYLSQHGVADDLTEELLDGVIFQTSPSGFPPMLRSDGEPEALLHYHSLCPEVIELRVATLLRHGNPSRRVAAAAAARHVASADRDAGLRLLPALLDALKFPEDWWDYNKPTPRVAEAIALVLLYAPAAVEVAINARWGIATSEYRVRMLRCFDSAIHGRSGQLSSEVARVILSRAVTVLSEPRAPSGDAVNQDYQRDAADLLKRTVPMSPTSELSTNTFLYLLLSWLEHTRVHAESEPEGPLGVPEKMAEQAHLGYTVRTIADSLVAAGRRQPGDVLTTCEEMYGHTETSAEVRAQLVHIAGRVAAKSFDHTGDVLPLIYTAAFSNEQVVRAAGLRAADSVLSALPSESIPPLLAQAVVAGLTDQYLIVVAAAIEAIARIPTDLIKYRPVVKHLLAIAISYAPDRGFESPTENAIRSALHLAEHDPQLLANAKDGALSAVNLMPAYDARKTLSRQRSLRKARRWVDTAIRALRADEDPRMEFVDDRYKQELLEELARQNLSDDQIESLEQIEVSASRFDRQRLLLAADVFAEQGRPDLSSRLIRKLLEDTPDTVEMSELRRWVLLTLLRFELEVAIASRDRERQESIGSEATGLCAEEETNDSLAAMQARTAVLDELAVIEEGARTVEPLARVLVTYRDTTEPIENDVVWAFCELVESLIHGVRWTDALWNAEPDSERHAVAARIRAAALADHIEERWPPDLAESCQLLANLTDHHEIPIVAKKLSRVPQPPRITSVFRTPQAPRSPFESERQRVIHSVALLIRLDGEPVMRPTVLRPGAMHQFTAEARVKEWPNGADRLEVTFLAVHPRDYLYASDVTFTADALEQPLEIRVAGERPPNAPPLNLTARATFRRGSERLDTRLAGNTTLELATFDSGTATPQNMPHTATRLQDMMSELQNRLPHLDAKDHRDTRLLLEGILRYAHTVLDERLPEHNKVDEKWFRRQLRFFLSADSQIGTRLTRGGGRAGGTTDLELDNIVLELKVEKTQPISLERATGRFINQPTQYASAGDSPVSLLVVLDASPKRAPAGVMGNDIGWAYPQTSSGPDSSIPSMVGIAIIRTGFPRPSDFSR